jgi:hypothetical protein
MVVDNNKINNNKKCRQIAGNFNCRADAAVQPGSLCSMKHIQDFPRSLWMLPSGKCLRRIALAAAMIDNFGCKQKTLTKHNFPLANLW